MASLAVSLGNARKLIERTVEEGLVPLILGQPGVGKSELVHAIAKTFNLKLLDLRLAQCDPTDLLGFPTVDKETGRAGYMPMDTFPLQGDPLPDGYDGWLLFLDEMTSADRGVQKAAYKLVLDRMVGMRHLHDNVVIIGAGNRLEDNAIVEEMSTALQSRLIHLEVTVDAKEWIDWALQNNVDHRVTSYIKFRTEQLSTFKPDHTDKTYACPRTWVFASRLMRDMDVNDLDFALPLLAGTLSEGVAREFLAFTQIYKGLPKMQDILATPQLVAVPTEPSILYALTGSLASHATKETVDALMKYIVRLAKEFQVIALREIVRRDRAMVASPAVDAWVKQNATELF